MKSVVFTEDHPEKGDYLKDNLQINIREYIDDDGLEVPRIDFKMTCGRYGSVSFTQKKVKEIIKVLQRMVK